AQEAQSGEERAAARDLLPLRGQVQAVEVGVAAAGEVGVLGERDRGQADLLRLAAGGLHVAPRGVPGELRVDVEVGRRGDGSRVSAGAPPRPAAPRSYPVSHSVTIRATGWMLTVRRGASPVAS